MIREGRKEDFVELISLFKSFFETHTIFQNTDEVVLTHLQKEFSKNVLLVYENTLIKGAMFLVHCGSDATGSHKLWKFRHFAFESVGIATELLREAEKRVCEQSGTAKIELTIAENEEGIDFYKEQGYVQEARLTNHYRFGEVCFVLSKSFNLTKSIN
jgi:hypothetical protein